MPNQKDYNWTDPATGKPTAPGIGNPTLKTTSPEVSTPITTKPVTTKPVAINGAKYNTREKQQEAFTNIQPQGNTLYGIPKAPIVPDIIPQKDLVNTMTPEKLSTVAETAKGLVNFNTKQIDDLNKAYQRQVAGTSSETDDNNIAYAKDKGWQPTEEEKPTGVIGENTPEKSTIDQIFEGKSNLTAKKMAAKAEAMKSTDLMAKGEDIATAETLVNKLRTDLQNQGILDIKEQDVIRDKPILTSQIQGQLNKLSREQKLDTMILQNNYNNALVESQIAQGNYDRAMEIVKETANDAYNMAVDQVNALLFRNEIEDKAANKLKNQLEDERKLALEGYVQIKSPEGLKGLTEDQIYRDPVSKSIYLKPKPQVASKMKIGGITYGFDKYGNKIATYGVTETTKGTTTTSSNGISKDNVKAIEKGLSSRIGSDGYLSPEDYNGAKQEWINAKGTPASFDKKFKDRRNPDNHYYNVQGAIQADNIDQIQSYKDSGETAENLIANGYEKDKVDQVFKTGNYKKKHWWEFWK